MGSRKRAAASTSAAARGPPERATTGQRAVRLAALVDGIRCKDDTPSSPRKEHWFDNVGQVLHRRSTAHMVLKRAIGDPAAEGAAVHLAGAATHDSAAANLRFLAG